MVEGKVRQVKTSRDLVSPVRDHMRTRYRTRESRRQCWHVELLFSLRWMLLPVEKARRSWGAIALLSRKRSNGGTFRELAGTN